MGDVIAAIRAGQQVMFAKFVQLFRTDKKVAVTQAHSRDVVFCNGQSLGIRRIKQNKVIAMNSLVAQDAERVVMAAMGNLVEIFPINFIKFRGRFSRSWYLFSGHEMSVSTLYFHSCP